MTLLFFYNGCHNEYEECFWLKEHTKRNNFAKIYFIFAASQERINFKWKFHILVEDRSLQAKI